VPRPGSTATEGPDYNGRLSVFVREYWDVISAARSSPSLARAVRTIGEFQPVWSTSRTNDRRVQNRSLDSLALDCGATLAPVEVAYETYGPAERGPLQRHPHRPRAHRRRARRRHLKNRRQAGWWDSMIGKGKAFDTDKYS